MAESIKMQSLMTRADVRPESVNVDERTVEVIFGTNTPVLRKPWWSEPFYEVLSFKKESVRLDRINSGGPVLKQHNPDKQIGVIVKASIEDNRGIATVRFSKNKRADKVWNDIVDGIVKNISVGYNVYEYRQQGEPDAQIPTYVAEDWEPAEISTVSIPADYNAGIRADNKAEHTVKIFKLENRKMAEETKTPGGGSTPKTEAGNPVNVDEIKTAERAAIIQRSNEIRSAVRAAKLSQEFEDSLLSKDITIDEARKLIIEEFTRKDPNAGTGGHHVRVTGTDEVDKVRAGMIGAMMVRLDPKEKLSGMEAEFAKEYRGSSLIDLARECCENNGVKTRGITRRQIAEYALSSVRGSGGMSTSDFAYVLGNVFNKRLVKAYEVFPRTFTPFCSQSSANDFRDKLLVKFGDIGSLDKIEEGGEYSFGSVSDSQEKYRVYKYGKLVNITWEAIVNDDLNAFSRIPKSIAQAAAQKQSDIVYGLILDNKTMADGVALFDSAHGNLAASGGNITIDTLGAGRSAMRNQKNTAGDFLNLTPKFLIVGPAKETVANQMTSVSMVATKNLDINPTFNTSLIPIVEPRLQGNSWHLAADPNMIDTIEYSFLDGEGELFTEQRQGFNVDGIEIKARMVFGAGLVDYRGLYKNPGN